MKLSVSNIGWRAEEDSAVYSKMKELNYTGLEIAPTRIFPELPYEKTKEAREWYSSLKKDYGFCVSSMQSIWFGRSERVFGTKEERAALVDYTKKAILFAEAVECKNLVFGCPRNRSLQEGDDPCVAIEFFSELGEFAKAHGTVVSMEPNPPIYNTNYINDTKTALELIREVSSEGFRLNLDLGTMLHNEESVDLLAGNTELINHIHISKPFLAPVEETPLHRQLKELLKASHWDGFLSIEMAKQDTLEAIMGAMEYVAEIFS